MSFILPTLIFTPLLKVPLLLGHTVCTYHGMTPPSVPPLPEERRLRAPDFLKWKPQLQKNLAVVNKVRNSFRIPSRSSMHTFLDADGLLWRRCRGSRDAPRTAIRTIHPAPSNCRRTPYHCQRSTRHPIPSTHLRIRVSMPLGHQWRVATMVVPPYVGQSLHMGRWDSGRPPSRHLGTVQSRAPP